MKTEEEYVRVESIQPIDGKIRVRYLPPSTAKNPEFMKRHGFRLAAIEKPVFEQVVTQEIKHEEPTTTFAIEEVKEAPKKKTGRPRKLKN